MNIKRPSSSAPDLVAAVSSELTPAERRIAEEVLAEPTLLAFGTVSELADRVGTSRPTVVRFANKLGFDGYTQLQRHVRSDLSHRLARPSERTELTFLISQRVPRWEKSSVSRYFS